MALQIVADGEGASKVVTIRVTGADSREEADVAARSVANSLLVKTSWVEDSVSWGRVMDALGYSAARVVEEQVDIDYNQIPAVRGGMAADTDMALLKQAVGGKEFVLDINLHLGSGEAVVYTCECTEAYVKINI